MTEKLCESFDRENNVKLRGGGIVAREGAELYSLGCERRNRLIKKQGLLEKARGLIVQNPHTGFFHEGFCHGNQRWARFPDLTHLRDPKYFPRQKKS